jgi:Domain of unknown function (DUF4159)
VRRRRHIILVLAALVALVLAVRVDAQFRQRGFRGFGNLGSGNIATDKDFDGAFHFCRVLFRSDPRGDGGNWSVDYPRADINLSVRLSELTRADVSMKNGEPNPLLIRLTDDALFRCPFIMMTEVGSAFIDENEAAKLREYLLKGGFLWADDFWGSYAWEWWVGQFSKVLNPSEYPIIDLPSNHPLFSSQFVIKKVPQIASINYWAGSGGDTSERGADSAEAHARAVLDKHGNIMVLMTHNTDLGDSFEREADDPQYFYQMSVPGYAFGINALLYALTH